MIRRWLALAAAAAVATLAATPATAEGDPRAAERRYRIARRLAVEGSGQAAAALREVVELDPDGPLADDALLDLADLEGLAGWPEQLGRMSRDGADRALAALDELIEGHPAGDRVTEARLRRALLWLEPVPARSAARARLELLALSTGEASAWSDRARYARVWLDETEGRADRARAGYLRLVIDLQGQPEAVRSLVGVARLLARRGAFGEAAARAQEAVEQGAPEETGAVALRELTVRGVLRGLDPSRGWPELPGRKVTPGAGGVVDFARLPDGGWLVADRRGDAVSRYDADGRVVGAWALADLQAVAVDPYGRGLAAAGATVYRLGEDRAVRLADQGDLAPVSALAADAAGGVWLADRRGSRVGRIDPAGERPELIWEDRQFRLSAMAWDGRRIVATDPREGALIAILPDGGATRVGPEGLVRPVDISVDPAGQLAILDVKAAAVVLLGPDGEVRARLSTLAAGVARAAGVALGPDGSLALLDEDTGAVWRVP